jgi:hypothetical protein
MAGAEFHANLLSSEFVSTDFLAKYRILAKRINGDWTHYIVSIPEEQLEAAVEEIKSNLIPLMFYAHVYNEDGSRVIVIFPNKVFELPFDDRIGWENVNSYMEECQIPRSQRDPNPKKFSDEEAYYSDKPPVG